MRIGKTLLLIFFGIIFANTVFSQEKIINHSIGFLGNPVPAGFSRMDRTSFSGFVIDDYGEEKQIQLFTQSGIVIASMFGVIADFTHEAREWLAQYYIYFEDNKWLFLEEESDDEIDVYFKNDIYVIIPRISRRDDGMIVAVLMFTKEELLD